MSFGLFDAALGSEQEVKIARQASVDKFRTAAYDVREQLGGFLLAASSLDEFRDRVAMVKADQSVFRVIEASGLHPSTGVVRRIVGKNSVLEQEFRQRLAAPHGNNGHGQNSWKKIPSPDGHHGYTNGDFQIQRTKDGLWQLHKAGNPEGAPVKSVSHAKNLAENVKKGLSSASPGATVSPNKGPTVAGPAKQSRHHSSYHYAEEQDRPSQQMNDVYSPTEGQPTFEAEGDFKGYLDDVASPASDDVRGHAFSGGSNDSPTHEHTGDPDDTDFEDNKNDSEAGIDDWPNSMRSEAARHRDPDEWDTDGSRVVDPPTLERGGNGRTYVDRTWDAPGPDSWPARGRHRAPEHAARLGFALYADWCQLNGVHPANMKAFDRYASRLSDDQYLKLAAEVQAWEFEHKPEGHSTKMALVVNRSDDDEGHHETSVHARKPYLRKNTEPKIPDPSERQASRRQGGGVHRRDEADGPAPRAQKTRPQHDHVGGPFSIGPGDRALMDGKIGPPGGWDAWVAAGHPDRVALRRFVAWSRAQGLAPVPQTFRRYAKVISKSEHRVVTAALSKQSAPDYLQKADDALTNLLNQKAEEFQETIAPLQQALITVQQAEQLQAQQNPLNVMPTPGTVNVMPGGDQGGGPVSDPTMDPSQNPAAALLPGGGGAQGMPPAEDPSQQVMASWKRAAISDDYDKFLETPGLRGGDDLEQFEAQRGPLSPGQRARLQKHPRNAGKRVAYPGGAGGVEVGDEPGYQHAVESWDDHDVVRPKGTPHMPNYSSKKG